MPVVLADDARLVFGYALADSEVASYAIFCIDYLGLRFGYPNDEAVSGHRYANHISGFYNAYEVHHSDWIEEIGNANKITFPNSDGLFSDLRHFIFFFHDTTLEFVSRTMSKPQLTDESIMDTVTAAFRA